jgi:P27 family predicted phage terminase small subunit
MRGPAPKPTSLRLLQGNPAKRRLNDAEPPAPPAIPSSPPELSPRAQDEWARITPLLLGAGLISHLDQRALASYCTAVANFAEASEHLAAEGLIVLSPNGYPMQSPWLAIQHRSTDIIRHLAQEFGLTPSARSRVRVDDANPIDEFEEYLRHGQHLRDAGDP